MGAGLKVYGCGRSGVGFEENRIRLSEASVKLSRILTERIDDLISLPVLKNHQMAGVTLSMKNHFGSIDRPMLLHGRERDCSPGIAELNAQPAIRDRTRLVIIDAMFGTYSSGLGARPDFAPMSLIVATDPVAADSLGQKMINARRVRKGLDPLDARHLHDAAGLGLGVSSTSGIEEVELLVNPAPEKPRFREASGRPRRTFSESTA
jgi:uncharacterized protein (DUF362 family)